MIWWFQKAAITLGKKASKDFIVIFTTSVLETIIIKATPPSAPFWNRRLLVSDTRHFSVEQPINPYYGDTSVDTARAAQEHSLIVACFREANINVVNGTSPSGSQDGVYTANWALVRGDLAVLARLPKVRHAEQAHAKQELEALGKTVVEVPDGLRFSGQGDALACGDYLLCGQGYRSDTAAQSFAAQTLGYERVQLQTVPQQDGDGTACLNAVTGWPDSFFYDIDLALAVIRHPTANSRGLIAYCPQAFTVESRRKIQSLNNVDTITVSLFEATHAFALNLVSTGRTVIMSATAPLLAAKLRSHGLRVLTPPIHELAKGGGYIRCISLTLD